MKNEYENASRWKFEVYRCYNLMSRNFIELPRDDKVLVFIKETDPQIPIFLADIIQRIVAASVRDIQQIRHARDQELNQLKAWL